MKFKKLIILIIITLININIYPSLQRVKTMAGKTAKQLYALPDLWNDMYNVNPAYSMLHKNGEMNLYSTSEIDKYDLYKFSEYRLLLLNNTFGILFPVGKFRLGFFSNYDSFFDKIEYDDKMGQEYLIEYIQDISNKILFSIPIIENIYFGFDIGFETAIYNNLVNFNLIPPFYNEAPYFHSFFHNAGFVFNRERIKTSISIPMNFHFRNINFGPNIFYLPFSNQTIFIYSKIKLAEINFKINTTNDIQLFARDILFRIIGELEFNIGNYEVYMNDNYIELAVPFKIAFSVNHKFYNKKILLFYGMEIGFTVFSRGDENSYKTSNDNKGINLFLSFFTGTEILVTNTVTLRFGNKIQLMDMYQASNHLDIQDNYLDDEYNSNVLQIELNTGIKINLSKNNYIEITQFYQIIKQVRDYDANSISSLRYGYNTLNQNLRIDACFIYKFDHFFKPKKKIT